MNYLDVLNREECIFVDLEKTLYSKQSILKAAYKFTDLSYIYIKSFEIADQDCFRIYFMPKNNGNNLIHEFMNELVDQELRQIISDETKKIREIIVTKALLSGRST